MIAIKEATEVPPMFAPLMSNGEPATVELMVKILVVVFLETLIFFKAPDVIAAFIAVSSAVANAATVAAPAAAEVTCTPLMVTDAVSVLA